MQFDLIFMGNPPIDLGAPSAQWKALLPYWTFMSVQGAELIITEAQCSLQGLSTWSLICAPVVTQLFGPFEAMVCNVHVSRGFWRNDRCLWLLNSLLLVSGYKRTLLNLHVSLHRCTDRDINDTGMMAIYKLITNSTVYRIQSFLLELASFAWRKVARGHMAKLGLLDSLSL